MKILLSSYHQVCRTFKYGIMVSLPFLLIWLIFKPHATYPGELVMSLNAETILRQLSTFGGLLPGDIFNIFLALGLFWLCAFESKKYLVSVNLTRITRTIAEAIPFAIVLYTMSLFVWYLSGSDQSTEGTGQILFSDLVAKCGAAFFEEFLCRLIILGGTLWLLKKHFPYGISALIALFLSSFVFAEIHYAPDLSFLTNPFLNFGDSSYLFRFWAGLGLGAIYLKRGFGTAVWTHAVYGFISVFVNGLI